MIGCMNTMKQEKQSIESKIRNLPSIEDKLRELGIEVKKDG